MTVTPTLRAFRQLAKRGNVVPIYTTLSADLETPLGALLKLSRPRRPAFLFESVEGEKHVAEYSFVGVDPAVELTGSDRTLRARWCTPIPRVSRDTRVTAPDLLQALRAWMRQFRYVPARALPRFCGGLVGYLGYELVTQWEPVARARGRRVNEPDLAMMLATSMVIFDHPRNQLYVVSNALLPPDATAAEVTRGYDHTVRTLRQMVRRLKRAVRVPPSTRRPPRAQVRSNMGRAHFQGMVRQVKRRIRAGDVIQVVISQRFTRAVRVPPIEAYRALRTLNPSPYMYYLSCGGEVLVGSSPELLVRLEGRTLETRPIAGTRPRGADEHEDARLAAELLRDPKERAEHLMLVDLGRNDVGRVAMAGSVTTPDFCVVEKYSHVMHLVSRVMAQKRSDVDAFDVLRAAFPAGTVSGAPKVRAMQLIADLESDQRGSYAGCVGYIGFSGNMDTCITIRTIVFKDGRAHVQAGAGIVADSVPATEYQETVNKAKALLVALEQAEQ